MPHRRLVHTTFTLPEVVPAGHVRVHVKSGSPHGFHAWTWPPDAPGLVACDCGWLLGPHYRLERAKSA
jgi:hypothetical protein